MASNGDERMKAVVYYRTRPSEPEASARALLAQKEAVRELFEKCEFRLIREFTEREGEVKGRPAFRAAIRAAAAHTTDGLLDVAFIIPSRAGIGSGEAFTEPRLRGNYRPFCWTLSAILDPALFEIALPGAPAALSLYGDFRWNEPDTRFYLCNAGTEPITEVVVVTDSADWPKPFDYPCRDGEPSGRYTKGPLRNNRFDGRTAGGDRHGGRRPAIHAFSR
ncbi:MAG TPA: hypothetical protein DDZ81_00665, partial [Acetobacteraceae bacterium]|nr:hypothetical protein [Acetobacteraceae bacterium]